VKYTINLVSAQVTWDKGGNEPTSKYTFFKRKDNANHNSQTGFFICKEITSAIKRGWSLSVMGCCIE